MQVSIVKCFGMIAVSFNLLVFSSVPVVAQGDTLAPPPPRPELITPKIETAIRDGIGFLLSERDEPGIWRPYGYRGTFPTASTALVGLALLANGSTTTRGEYAESVANIADYLISCSNGNGLFTDSDDYEPRPMYSHAFALTFLALVLGQEGSMQRRKQIERVLVKGITLCDRTQTDAGGWGYTPNYGEDEGTLVVTQLVGLRACRDAGIPVKKSMIDSGVDYIRKSTNRDGTVRYRAYGDPANSRPGVTCAAIVALWHAGEYDSDQMRLIRGCVERRIAPRSGRIWNRVRHGEYIEYYLSHALKLRGGRLWEEHYKRLAARLVRLQDAEGRFRGDDSDSYGEVYSTAIALLILQLPYERLPVYES